MKVLIIGGCGYIGSAIYHNLKNKFDVDTVDLEWFGNYNNPKNIKEDYGNLSAEFLSQYDAIVHTAAHSSVPLCKDIYASFENNVTKLMGLVKKLTTQKFIYASSSCVYVTSDGKPKVEDELSPPTDGLTLSKTVLDHIMPLLGVEYYGLRFGSVNGWAPNMRTDLMINSMTLSAVKNQQVVVFNAHAHRPIISTNDLSNVVQCIIQTKEDKRGIYNAASFNENIGHVGQSVADYLKVPLIDRGVTGTYDFTISSEKLIKAFDFKFEDTAESIIDSIMNNPQNDKWGKRDVVL